MSPKEAPEASSSKMIQGTCHARPGRPRTHTATAVRTGTQRMTPADATPASTSILAHKLGLLPAVRFFTDEDGTHCVAVSLSGVHGAGREMLLNVTDWRHISETVSPWFQVVRMSGVDYVVSSSKAAVEIARQNGRKMSSLFLARYLAQPGAGLNVGFANGDRLDCRRSNLIVRTRSEHSKTNVETQRAKQLQRAAEQRAAMAAANAAAQAQAGVAA